MIVNRTRSYPHPESFGLNRMSNSVICSCFTVVVSLQLLQNYNCQSMLGFVVLQQLGRRGLKNTSYNNYYMHIYLNSASMLFH